MDPAGRLYLWYEVLEDDLIIVDIVCDPEGNVVNGVATYMKINRFSLHVLRSLAAPDCGVYRRTPITAMYAHWASVMLSHHLQNVDANGPQIIQDAPGGWNIRNLLRRMRKLCQAEMLRKLDGMRAQDLASFTS